MGHIDKWFSRKKKSSSLFQGVTKTSIPEKLKTPWNLRPVELHPGDDKNQIDEFSSEMLKKWNKGRKEHGVVFKTDPLDEAMQECLDCSLYLKVLYFRIKALKERTVGNDKTGN